MRVENIFGLEIAKLTFEQAINELCKSLNGEFSHAKVVVTPNVDHVVKLHRNFSLLEKYRNADYIFADGFPIVLASKLLLRGKGIPERVTGADLFPALCQKVSEQRGKIFLLGGHPGKEEFIYNALQNKYPGATFEIFSPSFEFTSESSEALYAVDRINSFMPDITFACLGLPKQELWAFRHRHQLNSKLICCFGAAFEFDLGLVRRAPLLMQRAGFEWLWRLLGNPRRLARRYLVDGPYFLRLVFDEISKKKEVC